MRDTLRIERDFEKKVINLQRENRKIQESRQFNITRIRTQINENKGIGNYKNEAGNLYQSYY